MKYSLKQLLPNDTRSFFPVSDDGEVFTMTNMKEKNKAIFMLNEISRNFDNAEEAEFSMIDEPAEAEDDIQGKAIPIAEEEDVAVRAQA